MAAMEQAAWPLWATERVGAERAARMQMRNGG